MPRPRRTSSTHVSATPEISRISSHLVERRVKLGLTQQVLADLSGVSRSSIQSLEHGLGGIRLESLIAIADILGMRVDVTSAETPSVHAD
ncbi:helix-turn-helix transcriptional regulator [Gordonia sp. TBRC 11910]|uniref:Helix-turn-helix transcriptional regulator n=1 Tax=Gordonia asplenii TaxID=2725283 RepID=A0A848KSY9_9ACTN|nr:helix-turn-helix domain-containing protein [Gordonia asplenii]NMO01117.1 helix-turn-helix transcriptional regulator [Gordonia asplenii]